MLTEPLPWLGSIRRTAEWAAWRLVAGCLRREESEDAAAEFLGRKAIRCGVKGAGDNPKLFGATGGGVNHFRMAAGERVVILVAD